MSETKWRIHLRVTDEVRGQWTVTAAIDNANPIDAILYCLTLHSIDRKDVYLVKTEPWAMAEGRT